MSIVFWHLVHLLVDNLGLFFQWHVHQHVRRIYQKIDKQFCCQLNFTTRSYVAKYIMYLIKTIILLHIRLIINRFFLDLPLILPYFFVFMICEIRLFYHLFCQKLFIFSWKLCTQTLFSLVENYFELARCSKKLYVIIGLIAMIQFRRYTVSVDTISTVFQTLCMK